MKPRDLPASFIKATKTYHPDKTQPARAEAQRRAIEEQERSSGTLLVAQRYLLDYMRSVA